MNIYLVVEGPIGEKQVYAHWVPLVNPQLRLVSELSSVGNDNFVIYSGGGYPNYFEVIESGVRDVEAHAHIDRLVIAVDSEEMALSEKWTEINDFIQGLKTSIDYRIVVQHFCLETWALGNRSIVSRKPKDHKLRDYINHYNVLSQDPELMPGYAIEKLNRSQLAERYLRRLLIDRYRNLTYTKSNPVVLLNDKYFARVKDRCLETNHIRSFKDFLSAFV